MSGEFPKDMDFEATGNVTAILMPANEPQAARSVDGEGTLEAAFRGFRESAEDGDPRACYRLAVCLLEGRGCETDPVAGLEWLLVAAGKGDVDAQVLAGSCFYNGIGGAVNLPAALHWYGAAARQGSAPAQFTLGDIYSRGLGVPRDPTTGARYWRDAAEQGNGRAQLNLGLALARGDGVPADMNQAIHWCKEAASGGYAKAEYNLAVLYADGPKDLRDAEAARRYMMLSANRGFAGAQYAVGRMHQQDDEPEALIWLRKAASQDHAPAAFSLFTIFDRGGCGEAQNQPVAETWLRRAAELHHAPAQYELGRRLLAANNDGEVAEEARRWIARAAKQGHIRACFALSVCYTNGIGGPHDPAKAWVWAMLAAERGDAKAELRLPHLKSEIDPGEMQSAAKALVALRKALPVNRR